MRYHIMIMLLLVLLISGCSSEPGQLKDEDMSEDIIEDEFLKKEPVEYLPEADVVYRKDSLEKPFWIQQHGDAAPWEGSLYLASSEDGLEFDEKRFFIQHAGVPDLLLADDESLIAVFQYFSYEDEDFFDKIAYSVSEDFGDTWSPVRMIRLDKEFSRGPSPVDPSIVQLEDGRFRLYFTYHAHGSPYAALFSAVSDSMDGLFESEGEQLSADMMLLDPAVAFFKDEWHHYTVDHETGESLHSVSSSGLDFKRKSDISMDFQFLGDAIAVGDKIRFYGTGRGVVAAESEDGYTFMKLKDEVVPGADPGVAVLPDGSYIIVYSMG